MANATNAEQPTPTPLRRDRPRLRPPNRPTLRFTPSAWAKLLYLRNLGPTEVGGFGISAAEDLLLIEEIRLVQQRCSSVTVQFQDEAVADFFDEMVDRGLPPERFARVWIHTHPGNSASPSCVDEETFIRSFGRSDWALMFILAQGGQTTARLRFHIGPGGDCELPVAVDFSGDFAAPDRQAWREEYQRCVRLPPPLPPTVERSSNDNPYRRAGHAIFRDELPALGRPGDIDLLEEFEQHLRDRFYEEFWEPVEQFAEEVPHG